MMVNTLKYFTLLEKLLEAAEKSKNQTIVTPDDVINRNIENIEKYLGLSSEDIAKSDVLQRNCCLFDSADVLSWKYACYLYYIMLSIKDHVDFDSSDVDKLVSVQHTNSFLKILQTSSIYGLTPYLPKGVNFQQNSPLRFIVQDNIDNIFIKLNACVQIYSDIFKAKSILTNQAIDYTIMEYMVGIFTLQFLGKFKIYNPKKESNDECLSKKNSALAEGNIPIYEGLVENLYRKVPPADYFKYLLVLKSFRHMTPEISKLLHRELLKRLYLKNGFVCLCQNLLALGDPTKTPRWRRSEALVKIIAHKGHPKNYYSFMVDEINDFMMKCLQVKDLNEYVIDCAGCLTAMYQIVTIPVRELIRGIFMRLLFHLSRPMELLTGSIIFEDLAFRNGIKILVTTFDNRLLVPMKTTILVPYIPLLISLYAGLPTGNADQQLIRNLITHILANRSRDELKQILNAVLFDKLEEHMVPMHPRVLINYDDTTQKYSVIVGPTEEKEDQITNGEILLKILKQSEHNNLICDIFKQLLEFLQDVITTPFSPNEFLGEMEDLDVAINKIYKHKIVLFSLVAELVAFKPFHFKIKENSSEIYTFLKTLLNTHIGKLKLISNQTETEVAESEQMSMLILSVVQEFIHNLTTPNELAEIKQIINLSQNLSNLTNSDHVKVQFQYMNELFDEMNIVPGKSPTKRNFADKEYNLAINLLNEKQPHLRVQGISQLMVLLTKKDSVTISNKHAILAIALNILKDEDSYTFLNTVRLLVALGTLMHTEVFDSLIAEYQNEDDTEDYRLKIGEVIVKVTEGLGPVAHPHKDYLLNCFIAGVKSDKNVFRMSSLSNLGTLCQIFSYQVHHFFQELMLLIENIARHDEYLPARRASIMVLSKLLLGIDNLMDFQDYLLPIYRMLKEVIKNETDETSLTHAALALECLQQKIKEALLPADEMKLQKEIKILGINDREPDPKKKRSILEII